MRISDWSSDVCSSDLPFLKRFTVFNVDQCEGLPHDLTAPVPATDPSLILPKVEELIRRTGADFRIGGDRAFYDVPGDFIRVPPPEAYHDTINWHRTALHEAGQDRKSTRLNSSH